MKLFVRNFYTKSSDLFFFYTDLFIWSNQSVPSHPLVVTVDALRVTETTGGSFKQLIDFEWRIVWKSRFSDSASRNELPDSRFSVTRSVVGSRFSVTRSPFSLPLGSLLLNLGSAIFSSFPFLFRRDLMIRLLSPALSAADIVIIPHEVLGRSGNFTACRFRGFVSVIVSAIARYNHLKGLRK